MCVLVHVCIVCLCAFVCMCVVHMYVYVRVCVLCACVHVLCACVHCVLYACVCYEHAYMHVHVCVTVYRVLEHSAVHVDQTSPSGIFLCCPLTSVSETGCQAWLLGVCWGRNYSSHACATYALLNEPPALFLSLYLLLLNFFFGSFIYEIIR